ALRAGALGGLGGLQGVRVHVLERVMTVDEAHLVAESLPQHADGRRRLLAVGAFEVAVLDDRYRGVIRTLHVVGGVDGLDEVERAALIDGHGQACFLGATRFHYAAYRSTAIA